MHRDLAARNVLITTNGTVKVCRGRDRRGGGGGAAGGYVVKGAVGEKDGAMLLLGQTWRVQWQHCLEAVLVCALLVLPCQHYLEAVLVYAQGCGLLVLPWQRCLEAGWGCGLLLLPWQHCLEAVLVYAVSVQAASVAMGTRDSTNSMRAML